MTAGPGFKLPRLREARDNLGLSRRELAAKVQATERSIHRWESGQPCRYRLIALQLAEALNVDLEYLRGAATNPQGRVFQGDMKWLVEWLLRQARGDGSSGGYQLLEDVTIREGEFRLLSDVDAELQDPSIGGAVIACCSDKSNDVKIDSYFESNFRFATNLKTMESHDRARVARIFVPIGAKFSSHIRRYIEKHIERRADGVRPLVLLPGSMAEAEEQIPGLSEAIKKVFGFILIRKRGEYLDQIKAFVHVGRGNALTFFSSRNRIFTGVLLQIWEWLSELAVPASDRSCQRALGGLEQEA